ncbi:hypothetical protein EDB19DRAFT_1908297 [Suillus lakei]|nr:hypothetical protein EDB19DRAFT_1908297 [Suillus lakei]
MPPHPTPSEIAARKWNTQKKAQASKLSAGEKPSNTEEIWNKIKTSTHKCTPTATALQSVLVAKLVQKTPAEKLDNVVVVKVKVKVKVAMRKPASQSQSWCQLKIMTPNSIGVQSCEDFVSVLDGNDEPELPIAMVCLIATLIYVILKDWSSGNPPLSAQVRLFNSSFHISVYKAHQVTLTCIFDGSQKKYHVLMVHLYKAVSVVESLEPAGSLDSCNYLDLDAMGED